MFSALQHVKAGLADLRAGALAWRVWHLIGSAPIRRRYARSRLGQTWLTVSSALFVILYGLIFSLVFSRPIADILPYIAVSLTFWRLISGIIGGATTCFTSNAAYYRNQRASFAIAVFARIYQDLIIFAHEFVVVLIVIVYFGIFRDVEVLSFLISLFVLLFTCLWLVYLVGILCARYRDLGSLIESVMRAAFLLTPIIWKIEMVPEKYQSWLLFNPFVIFLSIVRDPLLGEPLRLDFLGVAVLASLTGFACTLWFVGKYNRYLIFWI